LLIEEKREDGISGHDRQRHIIRFGFRRQNHMNLREKFRETGAAGYILLWLLGIPIPILLLIFLLRGCT
jgi:hypothetical protein